MLSPVLAWLVIKAAFPSGLEELSRQLVLFGLSSTAQSALLGPLALGVFALLVFGPYSRRLELEADLFACYGADPAGQLTPRGVDCFVSALEKLGAGSGGRRSFAWLHPTIHERVRFLTALAPDGLTALPLERRRRNFGRLLAAGVLSAIGYLLLVGAGIS
jgi:Zn-dependent protease with chaperone function